MPADRVDISEFPKGNFSMLKKNPAASLNCAITEDLPREIVDITLDSAPVSSKLWWHSSCAQHPIGLGIAMIEVRFHSRGRQGAKITSRILGRSGFLSGLYVQDFAARERVTPEVGDGDFSH